MFYSARKIKEAAKRLMYLTCESYGIPISDKQDTSDEEILIQKYLTCNYKNLDEVAIVYWNNVYKQVGVTVDKKYFENMKKGRSERDIEGLYRKPKKIRKILINIFG